MKPLLKMTKAELIDHISDLEMELCDARDRRNEARQEACDSKRHYEQMKANRDRLREENERACSPQNFDALRKLFAEFPAVGVGRDSGIDAMVNTLVHNHRTLHQQHTQLYNERSTHIQLMNYLRAMIMDKMSAA